METTLPEFSLAETSLVNPADMPCPDMHGKTVVLLPITYDFKLFKQAFGFKEPVKKLFCAELMLNAPRYPHVALCGNFIGGPQAAMLLEVLAARGARTFWFCGLCGALSPQIQAGSIFVANSAFSDEGTARHYGSAKEFAASAEMLAKLTHRLNAANRRYVCGQMASIDALFRETPSKIAFYRNQGCQALDMETAALYAVAGFHGLNLCGLYAVSDVFEGAVWRHAFKSAELKAARAGLVEIIKEVV